MATRRRLQKLFALLLVLSMTMGMLNITAFATEGELICDKQEHTHTTACYQRDLTCGLAEGEGSHSHTNACCGLTCGQEESTGHTHSDACYDAENNPICGLAEGEGSHSHTNACYGLTCGQEESTGHTHSDACYTETLVCELPEHTHSDACYAQEPEDEENTLTVTGTDKNGNPVEYTGPEIPAEPTESDASVYETVEEIDAALEAAEAALQEAEEAYARWNANFSDAWDNCGLSSDTMKQVSSIFTQASDCKKAWESWVDALTERRNELLSAGCICGAHQYACEEGAIDETCPVCSQYPDLCKGPQPMAKGSYWKFYYDKEKDKGTLRIVGDHSIEYPSRYSWPWDSNSYYIGAAGEQLRYAVTDIIVEDNVTKLGSYMFRDIPNVKTITIGNSVTEWGSAMFGGQNIETVTVTSPTFDSLALSGNGYNNTYHIDTLILDNPNMEVADNTSSSAWGIYVDKLVLANVKSVGESAFRAKGVVTTPGGIDDGGIGSLEIGNVGEIGACAFMDSYNLATITFAEDTGIRSIGASAFEGCTELSGEIVIPDSCTYVGDFAFQDCDKITNLIIPETTQLGYSNIFVKFPPLVERMEAILAGQFDLKETPVLDPMAQPSDWESGHLGKDNGTGTGDTQVSKAASWKDEDKTQAEVEFQFNYDKQQGMDFIFVVDYSGSMAAVGNMEADSDSRFTSMQSKLLDVSEQLLNTQGYDNRVAFVTFATDKNYLHTLDFTADYSNAESFVMEYDPYGSTNYAIALDAARKLIEGRTDTSREAAVIFISDGQPNKFFDGTANRPPEYAGESSTWAAVVAQINDYADAIKNIQQFGHDTKIFGVLQSIPSKDEERCTQVLQGVCTEGLFFKASDTQEFSDAINNAIGASYNIYTLVDTIDPAFTLDESSITVSAGTYQVGEDADGNTTITWTITGVPYLTHTMNYDLMLNQVDGSYPYGSFDTNEGDAGVALGADNVNAVATPVLTRERSSSGGGGSSYDYYNVTVNYLDKDGNSIASSHSERIREGLRYDVTAYDAIAIEGYTYDSTTGDPLTGTMNGNKVINVWYVAEDTDITDPEVPGGETPENPDGGDGTEPGTDPGVDIEDPDVPGAEVPETGDISALWLALSALSGTGLAGVTLLGRKKRDEE